MRARRERSVELRELVRGDAHVERREVLVEPRAPADADERHDVVAARAEPRDGQLGWRAALPGGQLDERASGADILLQRVSFHPRRHEVRAGLGAVAPLSSPSASTR